MRSVTVANYIVEHYGKTYRITNLSLNKLVYYSQAESLRMFGRTLFSDEIEAWEYGPVEPAVYHAFKNHGRSAIMEPAAIDIVDDTVSSDGAIAICSAVDKYGSMDAFDLVEFSHRDGSAWKNTYARGRDAEITPEDIVNSSDCDDDANLNESFMDCVRAVEEKWPNTIRILEDA